MNDVRQPAQSPDFETSYNVIPKPPRNFLVTNQNGIATFRIADRTKADGKGAPVGYRIYWIPSGLSPTSSITQDERSAISKMGTLVGSTQAAGAGHDIVMTISQQNGKTGKYVCVGVGSSGRESPSTHVVISPWGSA